ncbi:tyrosine-type recombinase/integrase [uncultured Pseudoteredinibacter sp.]|uniref:tyrosine-type recombinase/integrase n=1 Tax=uncultured Pseudoteredinibacter sp. TaxID=1641701 RepID=UPI00261101F5|nr:tyrosine-type recombinase/integrase [uncultured Pseudoteredinibacter sp.]
MDYPTGIRPSKCGRKLEIRYQVAGVRRSQIVDKKPNKTNIRYAASLRNQLIEGQFEQTKGGGSPNFGTIAQEYLNTAKLTLSSRNSYRDLLNKYWESLYPYPIDLIEYNLIWQMDNNTEWPSPKTRNNAVTALRQVFKLGKKRGLCPTNPAAELDYEKHQKAEIKPYTTLEKEQILSSLEGQALAYFTLAFETGARTGELLALTWDDISGNKMTVNKSTVRRVAKDSTKTAKGRTVLLTKRAQEAIKQLPTIFSGGHLFVVEQFAGGLNTQTVGQPHKCARWLNKQFKVAAKQHGINYRRAYNCRHTYASLGLTAGAKPGFLADQLGHSLEMFFNRYAKYMATEDDLAELEKLENFTSSRGAK